MTATDASTAMSVALNTLKWLHSQTHTRRKLNPYVKRGNARSDHRWSFSCLDRPQQGIPNYGDHSFLTPPPLLHVKSSSSTNSSAIRCSCFDCCFAISFFGNFSFQSTALTFFNANLNEVRILHVQSSPPLFLSRI